MPREPISRDDEPEQEPAPRPYVDPETLPPYIRPLHGMLLEVEGYCSHIARQVSSLEQQHAKQEQQQAKLFDAIAFVRAALEGMAPKVGRLDADSEKVYEQVVILVGQTSQLGANLNIIQENLSALHTGVTVQSENMSKVVTYLGVTNTTPPPSMPFRERLESINNEVDALDSRVTGVDLRATKAEIQARRINKTNLTLAKQVGAVAIAITALTAAIYQAVKAGKEAPSVETPHVP